MPDGPGQPSLPPGSQSGTQLIERKLATILSADVAEFSRLMSEDEEQTLRAFRGHKKVFESLVVTHHGRIFNTAGDAILAEFSSAVEAVRCATDVQSALRTRNDKFPPARQVRFRIGINLGDVMIQGQDLMGDGVNVAARLQTAAEPGGICISGSVHDQIRNKLSLGFHSMGERNYKNIPQPVRTFSIVEAESGVVLPSPKPESARKRGTAIGVAAAIVVVAVLGSAAYVLHQRANNTNAAPTVAITQPAPPAPVTPSNPSATTATSNAQPSSANSAGPANPSAAAGGALAKAAVAAADPQPAAKHSAAPGQAARLGLYDGVYSGPVCYGKTPEMPAHCYQAEGTIHGNKISGIWTLGPDSGINMKLDGDVTPSGKVTISMHSERTDGSPVATINLAGTVGNGVLKANGAFLRGRPANINWHIRTGASR